MYKEQLAALAAMSNKYGEDANFVLAGGGNTSYKSGDTLWVKGSGTSLATIEPEDFVALERQLLDKMWATEYPADEAEREAAVLADIMYARVLGENRRHQLYNWRPHKCLSKAVNTPNNCHNPG